MVWFIKFIKVVEIVGVENTLLSSQYIYNYQIIIKVIALWMFLLLHILGCTLFVKKCQESFAIKICK